MTDPLAFHVLVQLIKRDALDLDDIEEIADRLTAEGEDDAAIAVRGAFIEANAQPDPEPDPRMNLRLVANNRPVDGGNDVI